MPETRPITFNFTTQRLKSLPSPPTEGELTLHDTGVDGLVVRIRTSGAASYAVRYRIKGDGRGPQRMTLGSVDRLPLPLAREMAQEALLAARKGIDPVASRKAANELRLAAARGPTVAELIDAHERDQLSRSVVTATEAARSLRRELKGLAGTMAAAVSRQNIVSILDKVRDGVPGHSVPRPGLVATLRARIHGLLAFAEHAGYLPAGGNVMAGYRRSRKSKFERVAAQAREDSAVVLDMAEVAALWRACGDRRVTPAFGAHVRLLIALGSRRGETAAMRLPWMEPAAKGRPPTITIPAAMTKNGRPHVVPITNLVLSVIDGVPRWADTDLVTPARSTKNGSGKHRSVPISGWSKSWPRLLQVARDYGLKRRPTLHDLRKTFRSHMSRLGVDYRVAEALLNHADTNRLGRVYNRYDYLPEKTAALEAWAAEIEKAVALTEIKTEKGSTATAVHLRSARKARAV